MNKKQILKPKYDIVFQTLFGNNKENITQSFISDIKKHKTRLIVFAGDISERTRSEILRNAGEIPVLNLSVSKEILGNAVGTKPTVTLSLNDSNFKKGILEVK